MKTKTVERISSLFLFHAYIVFSIPIRSLNQIDTLSDVDDQVGPGAINPNEQMPAPVLIGLAGIAEVQDLDQTFRSFSEVFEDIGDLENAQDFISFEEPLQQDNAVNQNIQIPESDSPTQGQQEVNPETLQARLTGFLDSLRDKQAFEDNEGEESNEHLTDINVEDNDLFLDELFNGGGFDIAADSLQTRQALNRLEKSWDKEEKKDDDDEEEEEEEDEDDEDNDDQANDNDSNDEDSFRTADLERYLDAPNRPSDYDQFANDPEDEQDNVNDSSFFTADPARSFNAPLGNRSGSISDPEDLDDDPDSLPRTIKLDYPKRALTYAEYQQRKLEDEVLQQILEKDGKYDPYAYRLLSRFHSADTNPDHSTLLKLLYDPAPLKSINEALHPSEYTDFTEDRRDRMKGIISSQSFARKSARDVLPYMSEKLADFDRKLVPPLTYAESPDLPDPYLVLSRQSDYFPES